MKIFRNTGLLAWVTMSSLAFFGCEDATGPSVETGIAEAKITLSIQGTKPASLAKAGLHGPSRVIRWFCR